MWWTFGSNFQITLYLWEQAEENIKLNFMYVVNNIPRGDNDSSWSSLWRKLDNGLDSLTILEKDNTEKTNILDKM